MNAILGISAFYHDSAAALIIDGQIKAAAQEERFSRIKHDPSFPEKSIEYCLQETGLSVQDIKKVVFYEKPLLKFERLIETYTSYAPYGLASFLKSAPVWAREKLFIPQQIQNRLGENFYGNIIFTTHHQSHAASAFFPSPFEESAILTLDGVGEWTTTSWGIGRGNELDLKQEIRFPHSLGLLYSAFTYYAGFKVNSGEYKLMGLAPYGEPKYKQLIYDHLIQVRFDGSFWMNMKYFDYCAGLKMTNAHFNKLFGGPPRPPESAITQKEMDLAASIQEVLEEIILLIGKNIHQKTKSQNLCLAGGVALNCVANGRLMREGPFKNIWVQPAAGDAGGALGAALFHWHAHLKKPRTPQAHDSQNGSLLGPRFESGKIKKFLDSVNASYLFFSNKIEQTRAIANLLSSGKIVGLFQDRMEFGPRALGARSIVADARSTEMQKDLNLKIKLRESFRPFAPSCIEERVSDYFELDCSTPYMLLTAYVKSKKPHSIPAVTHVDQSARIQSVNQHRNHWYYDLIKEFERQTGCGVILNTSFNIRGEPIVCTPEDAFKCFMFTEIDALVMEDYLLLKDEQREISGANEYKNNFQMD